MTNVSELLNALEKIAPKTIAADWDPVGLHVGRSVDPANKVLLTIDLTDEIIDEAINLEINTIISYHPPIFKPLKKLTDSSREGRLALCCAKNNISVVSPHTALDFTADGVGSHLSKICGDGKTEPIAPISSKLELSKIIIFSPSDSTALIRNALGKIGVGKIGDYNHCSFLTKGSGSFLGNSKTKPFLGENNTLTLVEEDRLEMVIPNSKIEIAIHELLKTHPYEEPAFDIIPLKPIPEKNTGQAWMQTLDNPETPEKILQRTKKKLGIDAIRFAKSKKKNKDDLITRIAVCPGSGNDAFLACKEAGAELFITGEMRYHDLLHAIEEPVHVGLTGHSNSERYYLPILKEKLSSIIPDVQILVSEKDVNLWETLFEKHCKN